MHRLHENCMRRGATLGAHDTLNDGSSAWRSTCLHGSELFRCHRSRRHSCCRHFAASTHEAPTKRHTHCARHRAGLPLWHCHGPLRSQSRGRLAWRTSPDHRQAHGRRPRARWCQCLDARDCRVQRTTRYPGAAGEAARRWRPGPRCAHRRRTHIAAHWTAPASARRQAAPVSGQNCRCPPPAAPRSTRRPKNEQQPACHDGGHFDAPFGM